jgi:hypothetical protein
VGLLVIEWFRFALIVAIAAADHVIYETVLSFNTTRDFVRYRLRWIVRDKLRAVWARARR